MIDIILSSSVLILIILAIRFTFLGKINPKMQYGLWSLVVLRMLPISWLNSKMPESRLSVMHAAKAVAGTIHGASEAEQLIFAPKQGTIFNDMLSEDSIKTDAMRNASALSFISSIDWQLVFLTVWIIGAVAFGLWFLWVNFNFNRQLIKKRTFLMSVGLDGEPILDTDTLAFGNMQTRKRKSLPVYISDELCSPCLVRHRRGVVIYVTTDVAEDERKLHYAVLHELCHYRQHDLLWSAVRGAVLVFYWFHPLIWAAAIISKRDCELACDYEVMKKMNQQERLNYGRILVDLIRTQTNQKNVLQVASSMHENAEGMKERMMLIAKNKKRKASTLIIVILIAALAAGFTFTSAPEYVKEISGQEEHAFNDFTVKWADAYSARDARSIYEMCENEELFLTLGEHTQGGGYWMGVSSPWPWNKDYVINILDDSSADIYYYYRTSSPTVFVAKETITVNKDKSGYKVSQDNWKYFDEISSKAEFEEAYRFGVPELIEFAAAYQFQADDNSDYNEGRKEILEDPVAAAIEQLNLAGAKVTGIYTDSYAKKAVVKFAWEDGEVYVNLSQPTLIDEDDESVKRQATIWVVVNKNLTKEFRMKGK